MGRAGGIGTEEALDVAGLIDLHLGGLPYRREEGSFGGGQEDFKQFMGGWVGGLALPFGLFQEVGHTGIHSVQELVNSLHFELGSAVEERWTVLGVFDLLFAVKRAGVVGDMFPSDYDFQVVCIGQDLCGGGGIGGRDRVAVGV